MSYEDYVDSINTDVELASIEDTLTSLVVSNSIDFGAVVLEADIGGGNELVATATSVSSGFASNTAGGNGFSAGDALASFSLLMVPTVMVLSREPEILDLLGELYNSASTD
jgi:hypothetical protein